MSRSRVPVAVIAVLALAAPAAAEAAELTTARPCYTSGQAMTIRGAGWLPGSRWSVQGEQIFDSGVTGDGGTFTSTNAEAPLLPADGSTRPQTFTIRGSQDAAEVASTTFKVVNFLARPVQPFGNPVRRTRWIFSGFKPGRRIYVHVTRRGETYTTEAGWGDADCGILRTRLRRLPGVPASRIRRGRYRVYVDNRRAFSPGGLQYRASITI